MDTEKIDLISTFQKIVLDIVDSRIEDISDRGDAMARLYGEYVNIGKAAQIMGVSRGTINKLRDEGLIDVLPHIGIPVRSIAELPAKIKGAEVQESTKRAVKKIARFTKIEA